MLIRHKQLRMQRENFEVFLAIYFNTLEVLLAKLVGVLRQIQKLLVLLLLVLLVLVSMA